MNILVRNISIGVIAGLVFNTTCSAGPGILEVIEEPLASIERLADENSPDMQFFQQCKIEASKIVVTPQASLPQFKADLVTLCMPIAALTYTGKMIQKLHTALVSNLHTIDSVRVPDRGDSYLLRIAEVSEKARKEQEDPVIVRLKEIVESLKSDNRYTELTTSNKDRFGLSRNIVLSQYDSTCSMNALFNFLRSCSDREFAMIRTKCSLEATLVLDNLLTCSGDPVALREAVNGLAANNLWGMLIRELNLVPLYEIAYTKRGRIHIGVGCHELWRIASLFGLSLDTSAKIHSPEPKLRFDFEDIQKMVGALPNGGYVIDFQGHDAFLKKTDDEIIVYDSDRDNGIEGELFGFSYFNDEAINYLVRLDNYGEYESRFVFHKLII